MKWYDYCHNIGCEHLTDYETCSKGFAPDWCAEKDYEAAKDRKYYDDINREKEKRGLE